MYQLPSGGISRKRGRNDENDKDDSAPHGFQEHRTKRHLTNLPHRHSPEQKRCFLSTQPHQSTPRSPSFADITPSGSDSEDTLPQINEPRSYFSPWSSPATGQSQPQSSQASSSISSSQPQATHILNVPDSPAYSDDLEMTDTNLLYPGPFQADPVSSISARIPTPIHAQFSTHIRAADKAPLYPSSNYSFVDESAAQNMNGHRLPSPISEDEPCPSPSELLEGLGDVQMGEEEDVRGGIKSSPKKGHQRSKHSLRNWGGFGTDPDAGSGAKRGFSMGYRSDCEKCRMKVPGHFSHVITY